MKKKGYSLEEFKKVDWNATLSDVLVESAEEHNEEIINNKDSRTIIEKNKVFKSTAPKDEVVSSTKSKIIIAPKLNTDMVRYTAPKKRKLITRLINRIKYENDWYDDIEEYLEEDYYYVPEELEQSRMSLVRKEQKLYKRVQDYEDARDDITIEKKIKVLKTTAIVALLMATLWSCDTLIDEARSFSEELEHSEMGKEIITLENANKEQIQNAEAVLNSVKYDFRYLSKTEQLDAVIRIGTKVEITRDEAKVISSDFLNYSDEKWLEEIVKESYYGEFENFGEEEQFELKQLVYEMLDEEIKPWIRSPLKIEEIKKRNKEMTSNIEMEI